MVDRKLIASVALFRGLYDKDRDIYDVIAALLKAAIVFEKKWAFNTTEASHLLESTFGFQIPEAVISTTLRNRLKKKEGIVTFENGTYSLAEERVPDTSQLEEELQSTRAVQDRIIDDLLSYFEKHSPKSIDEQEQQSIRESFGAFLLDENVSPEHSGRISSYIITRQSEDGFQESLDAIREGYVIYNGIRYSSDLSRLGSWTTELTIYLDTEHLFNAAGFNGELYKQLFDDFYKLVREANRAKKKSIKLKYFAEAKAEVDNFFHVAELIIRREVRLNPSKPAMVSIVTGSKTASDIVQKKALLFSELNKRNITLETKDDFYDEPEYVVESADLIEKLKLQAKRDDRPFDEDACSAALKMFTKINYFRQGKCIGPLEAVGHIFLSGKSYTQFLAFHPLIRQDENSIPFSTYLDFLTNRFWFILKKGLSKDVSSPRSLSVIAKAQVVIAAQINHSVSEQYAEMIKQIDSGNMTIEEAEYVNHELRSKAATPEEITTESVEDRMQILGYEGFEAHLREKSRLEQDSREGAAAKQELAKFKAQRAETKRITTGKKATAKVILLSVGLLSLAGLVLWISFLLIEQLRSDSDSPLTIIALVVSASSLLIPLIKLKKIWGWLGDKHNDWSNL